MFTILYDDIVSIRRHHNTIDIKYGSLNQPHTLKCQLDRVSLIIRKILCQAFCLSFIRLQNL